MSLITYIEVVNHPNAPDIGIHLSTKRKADVHSHTCIDLSQEEAAQLLLDLREVIE